MQVGITALGVPRGPDFSPPGNVGSPWKPTQRQGQEPQRRCRVTGVFGSGFLTERRCQRLTEPASTAAFGRGCLEHGNHGGSAGRLRTTPVSTADLGMHSFSSRNRPVPVGRGEPLDGSPGVADLSLADPKRTLSFPLSVAAIQCIPVGWPAPHLGPHSRDAATQWAVAGRSGRSQSRPNARRRGGGVRTRQSARGFGWSARPSRSSWAAGSWPGRAVPFPASIMLLICADLLCLRPLAALRCQWPGIAALSARASGAGRPRFNKRLRHSASARAAAF